MNQTRKRSATDSTLSIPFPANVAEATQVKQADL
jgi:hypothetical protein